MLQRRIHLILVFFFAFFVLFTNSTGSMPTISVKGAVTTPEGSPQPNARVIFSSSADSRNMFETVTDASGNFTVSLMSAVSYNLRIMASGYPLQYFDKSKIDSASDGPPPSRFSYNNNEFITIRLTMTPRKTGGSYGWISGIVKDSTGAPLSQVTVMALAIGRDVTAEVKTDVQGKYSCLAPAQSHFIMVSSNNFPTQFRGMSGATISQPTLADALSVIANETIQADVIVKSIVQSPNTATMPRGGVSGHVAVKSSNRPAEGVIVCAMKSDSAMTNPGFNPLYNSQPLSPYSDTTLADGSYSISNIPQGRYVVYTSGRNYIPQFFNGADSIKYAQQINIDTTMKTAIDFSLRVGGSLSGRIVTKQGKAVAMAQVNCYPANGGKSSIAFSDSLGRFFLSGLSSGMYCLDVNSGSAISTQNTPQCNFSVAEGDTLGGVSLVVDQGSVIKGAYTAPLPRDSSQNAGFEIALFADSLFQTQNQNILQDNWTGWINLPPLSQSEFVSSVLPPGKWRYLFRPRWKNYPANSPGQSLKECWAYSFGNQTLPSAQTPVVLSGGDTARIPLVNFIKGYSVPGTISLEGGEKGVFCNVTAYIKDGNKIIPVSRADAYSDSVFELPGLIDGNDYFIFVNASNYQPQFWSPQGASIGPANTYHFSTIEFAMPIVRLLKTPRGYFDATPALSAWLKPDSAATDAYLVVCNAPTNLAIDSIVLYARDIYGAISTVVKFPYSPTQTTYTWRMTAGSSKTIPLYIFVGKGANITARSNIVKLDRIFGTNTSVGSLSAHLSPLRSGVQIDWSIDSLSKPTNNDTVILSRKTGVTGQYKRLSTSRGTFGGFRDGAFDKIDTGTTIYYKVEISSKRIIGQPVELKFTLTKEFLDRLPRRLLVGANELYKTIQSAIDAAKDYDVIRIDPGNGPYNENISLLGKAVSLEGNWQNGEPPAISGTIAITVPYTSKSIGDDQISISGLRIINSRTGIKSYSNVNVNQCLFAGNISEAVLYVMDSAAIKQSAATDPFAQYQVNGNIWQCTFVGKNQAVVAIRAVSGAVVDTTAFNDMMKTPINPDGYINIDNSIFYEYPSTTLPININSNRFMVYLGYCDFWRTSITAASSNIQSDSSRFQIDPRFKDTVDYFLSDSSLLKTLAVNNAYIGYDGRYWSNFQDQEKSKSLTVKNFKAKISGPRSASLSWDPLPDTAAFAAYIVFRVKVRDSLFVRQQSQWKLNLPEDSIFTVVDTFRTKATVFVDTTLIAGAPYIYAAAGIDSNGTMGNVDMPDSLPLSSFIIATEKNRASMKVGNMTAGAYGFTGVLIRWNKPASDASLSLAYALSRFSGGDSLGAAALDSNAVRKLFVSGAADSLKSKSASARDTFFIDTNAALGAVNLYVVAVADSLVPFERRPLAWVAVKTDSLPYKEQRPYRIVADRWNLVGPWGVGGIALENDSTRYVYQWNDDKVADKLYSQYTASNNLQGGLGYWIRCDKDMIVGVTSSMHQAVVRNRDSLSIKLRNGFTGWNLASSPLPFPVKPDWLNGPYVPYAWDGDSGQYTEQTTLEPWRGYWIYTDRDTQLPVRPTDISNSEIRRAVGKRLAAAEWELQVSLSGVGNDPDNFIGVIAPKASKLCRLAYPKPPQAFDYPQLFLVDGDTVKKSDGKNDFRFAKLYKASPAVPQRKLEWMIGVSPASKDELIRIRGAAKLPSAISLYWVSGAAAINLKENPEVKIQAHGGNVYGYIVATANPRDIGLYTKRFELRGCYPNPVRAMAAIDFTVPYSWNSDGSKKEGETRDLTLGVYDMAGRCVATVFSGKICVGEHRLIWRGSSETGHRVAQGAYIIRLSGSDFQKTMKIMKLR